MARSTIHVKLTHFGVGQLVSQEYLAGIARAGFAEVMVADRSSSQTGTQVCLAPESLAGKPASIRSDIHSLGVVLYQLLVGGFTRAVTIDWAKRIEYPDLREDLEHCLTGDPSARFAGAAQLAGSLRALSGRRAERDRERAEKAAVERAAYRRGMMRTAGAAAVILAVIAGLAVVGVIQSRQAKAAAAAQK